MAEKRTHFTYYSITPQAVAQLREYSRGDRDFIDGDAFKSLHERKLCDDSGRPKLDALEAHSLVNAAYSEGWHVNYK